MRSIWLALLLACTGDDAATDPKPDDGEADTDTDADADSDADADTDADTDTDTDTGTPVCEGIVEGLVQRMPAVNCTGGACVGDLYVALTDEDVRVNPDANRVQEVVLTGVDVTPPTGVAYAIDPAMCGVWFVASFLDVNGDGEPGLGDLVSREGSIVTSVFHGEPSGVDMLLIRIE